MIKELQRELAGLGDSRDAEFLQRYFKTGPGQYGEGDLFRGIRVPVVRKVCRARRELPIELVGELLKSPYHEDRLLSLFILAYRYEKGDASQRSAIYRLYLDSTGYINNWDLVDCSAGRIVGAQLYGTSREPLYRLAGSESLWERRIAIMATSFFIGKQDFGDTLRIAEKLLAIAGSKMNVLQSTITTSKRRLH